MRNDVVTYLFESQVRPVVESLAALARKTLSLNSLYEIVNRVADEI
jgi:hypothetical protein